MNPLAQAAIGSVIRFALAGLAGWLVSHGIWTQADSTIYVEAAALGVVSLGWGLYQKYKSRLRFIAALQLPAGASEEDAHLEAHTDDVKSQAFTEIK